MSSITQRRLDALRSEHCALLSAIKAHRKNLVAMCKIEGDSEIDPCLVLQDFDASVKWKSKHDSKIPELESVKRRIEKAAAHPRAHLHAELLAEALRKVIEGDPDDLEEAKDTLAQYESEVRQ